MTLPAHQFHNKGGDVGASSGISAGARTGGVQLALDSTVLCLGSAHYEHPAGCWRMRCYEWLYFGGIPAGGVS